MYTYVSKQASRVHHEQRAQILELESSCAHRTHTGTHATRLRTEEAAVAEEAMHPPPPVLRGPRELSYGCASFVGQQNEPFESAAPTILGEPSVCESEGGVGRARRWGDMGWGQRELNARGIDVHSLTQTDRQTDTHTHTHILTYTRTQLAPMWRRAAATKLEFSIQPNLFRGLHLDAQTGVISGLPRVQVLQRDRERERERERARARGCIRTVTSV